MWFQLRCHRAILLGACKGEWEGRYANPKARLDAVATCRPGLCEISGSSICARFTCCM